MITLPSGGARVRKSTKCDSETTKARLAEALEGCTIEEARELLWAVAKTVDLDPTELLGLDVDVV
jgi:hypothetical protein